MVLQADVTGAGHSVFSAVCPLAGSLAGEPVLAPGIELDRHLPVEDVGHVAVVEDDFGLVPLSVRIEFPRFEIRDVHRVVHGAALPRLELVAVVHLGEIVVVDELVLRTGDVRDIESRALDDVVHHSAVAALADLPLPLEVEIGIFPVSDYVAVAVAAAAFGHDRPVHDAPRAGERVPVVVPPSVECFAVEEKLPSVSLFGRGERVGFPAASGDDRRGGRQRADGKYQCLEFHIHRI